MPVGATPPRTSFSGQCCTAAPTAKLVRLRQHQHQQTRWYDAQLKPRLAEAQGLLMRFTRLDPGPHCYYLCAGSVDKMLEVTGHQM